MQKFVSNFFYVAMAIMLVVNFTACCDKEQYSPQQSLPDYIAFDKNHGDDLGDQIDYAIFGKDGIGYLYDFQEENPNIPQRLLIYDNKKDSLNLVINFDEEGLPKNILSEDFTIVLGNYVGNKFSAVIITKEGESQIFENIETDLVWDEYKNALSNATLKSSIQLRASASFISDLWKFISPSVNAGVSAIGCALSVAGAAAATPTVIGGVIGWGLAAVSCGSAISEMGQIAGWWESPEIVDKASLIGTYISCFDNLIKPKWNALWDCTEAIINTAVLISETLENIATQDVTLGKGVLETGNGNIKMTLTWDNYADIDLHCIDPGGYHIYWNNKYSPSGYLDYDNRVAYGPENIFFSPAPVGTYQVYLHYYEAHSGIKSVNFEVVIYENNRGSVYKGTIAGEGSVVNIATFSIGPNSTRNGDIQRKENVIDWNNLPKKAQE